MLSHQCSNITKISVCNVDLIRDEFFDKDVSCKIFILLDTSFHNSLRLQKYLTEVESEEILTKLSRVSCRPFP